MLMARWFRRFFLLFPFLLAAAFIWSCSMPSRPSVAVVETASGVRVEVRATSISPLGKAEFDLSAVLEAPDGRTLGPIAIGTDSGGYRRTNLYRTPEGCLVFVTRFDELVVIEANLTVAARGVCSRVSLSGIYRDCPDPAFDPATRPPRALGDGTGYLGTFEFNMWRETPDSERLWRWQFHHAGDEPECLRTTGR
jgi:hypothetical protein